MAVVPGHLDSKLRAVQYLGEQGIAKLKDRVHAFIATRHRPDEDILRTASHTGQIER